MPKYVISRKILNFLSLGLLFKKERNESDKHRDDDLKYHNCSSRESEEINISMKKYGGINI